MLIERTRMVGWVVAMTVALGATGCTRWAGDYQGTNGPEEGSHVLGALTLSGNDLALQADAARVANAGYRPQAAFDLVILPPCAAVVDPTGTTVTLSLCPLDPESFFLGAPVPEGATLDLVGDSTVVAAENGQIGQITFSRARLNVPDAASTDLPFDLTTLLLDRAAPVTPG